MRLLRTFHTIALPALFLCAFFAFACGPDTDRNEEMLQTAMERYLEGKLDQSLLLIDKILANDPEHSRALLLAARIEYYQQDMGAAEGHCLRVLKDQPDHVGARLLLARIYGQNGDRMVEALGQADEILAIDRGHVDAWYLKGRLHHGQGELSEAIQAYRAAIFYGRRIAGAHAALAKIYTEARLPGKAQRHEQAAQALDWQGTRAE